MSLISGSSKKQTTFKRRERGCTRIVWRKDGRVEEGVKTNRKEITTCPLNQQNGRLMSFAIVKWWWANDGNCKSWCRLKPIQRTTWFILVINEIVHHLIGLSFWKKGERQKNRRTLCFIIPFRNIYEKKGEEECFRRLLQIL